MFKKQNMYFILVVSAIGFVTGLLLNQSNMLEISLMIGAWLYFAWNLVEIFDIENDVFIVQMSVPKGINWERKFSLFLISAFGLIIMPGILFWAWLSK
jgi:hypothetical protein